MSIKFGDTLENQNTNFPIVDVAGDNVAGVHFVAAFTDGNLGGIPVDTRRDGAIVIDRTTHKIYVYKLADTANGANKWNDADGTAWAAQSGDNTLGSDSSFDTAALQNNTIAVAGLTPSTTITSAIDQLNEILGLLVPTAPKTLATQINAGGEFDASTFGEFTSFKSNRLVSNDIENSLPGLPATGVAVSHTTDTSIASTTITIDEANDCAVEAASLILSGSQNILNEFAAGDSTQTTSNLTFAKTTGGFPTTGDSAGFYTGISTFTYSFTGTLGVGAHKLAIGDADNSPAVTKIFYVQPITSPAAIAASSPVLDTSTMNEDSGHSYYYSSGVKYCGNTAFSFGITATVANIVPSGVSVYGAVLNSASNYNFAVGNAQHCFAAPPTLDYTAHQSVSSNENVAAGLANYSLSQNVSLQAANGIFIIGSSHKPRYDFKSMYGNDLNVDFASGSSKSLLAWNSRVSNSSTMVPFEEELFSSVNGDGVRVKETTTSAYTTTPGGAENLFAAWSPQFGNNSSGSFAINVKDAIVTPDGIENENATNFSSVGFPTSQAAATNFSTRNTDPQFITWKVPLNTSNPAQKLKITVTGTFTEFRVKQFDTGSTNSTFDANPSTNGWLDCMAVNSTQTNGGVPIGGCGDGAFFDGTESNTTLTITAGSGRWGNGGHLYIRIKLSNGEAITKLGVQPN